MTLLEPKAKRDSYGIDTYERGLAYAALLLRASNTHPLNTLPKDKNKFFGAVKLAFNFNAVKDAVITPSLIISAKFPYVSTEALLEGARFFDNVGDFGNKNPNPINIVCAASNPKLLAIGQEPVWVNSLEKYFIWISRQLIIGHLLIDSDTQPPISFKIAEDSNPDASITIDASLEFIYDIFLKQSAVLPAIKSVIGNTYVNPLETGSGSGGSGSFPVLSLGNVSDFGNSFNFGN